MHALPEVAGKKGRWEMSPAPLFMTRRHLVERIRLIVKNASVSPRRLVLFLATNLLFLILGICQQETVRLSLDLAKSKPKGKNH